jgi:2-oxoglutarate ferredoxin oxidoreductase subunit beta
MHRGFALLDIVSPCVTFNDHEGSTKSYAHTRQFDYHVVDMDYVPPAEEIKATYKEGEVMPLVLHDGSTIVLRKVADDYDLTNRAHSFKYLRDHFEKGEICTGLLYLDESRAEMNELMGSVDTPLSHLPLDSLHPGSGELKKMQGRFR